MTAYVSANLLATYLTVAARQAAEGSDLSRRSRWAIAHARRQLESERDVLIGAKPVTERPGGAGLRPSATGSGPSLAAIVLRSAPPAEAAQDRRTVEVQAAAYLTQVLDDLGTISGTADADAADRLTSAFSEPARQAA